MEDRNPRMQALEDFIAELPPETKEAEAFRQLAAGQPTFQDFLHLIMCRDDKPRTALLKAHFAGREDAAVDAHNEVVKDQVRPRDAFAKHFSDCLDRNEFREAWLKVRAPKKEPITDSGFETPTGEPIAGVHVQTEPKGDAAA